ncbi:hypothetical protein CGCSCA4_v011218 [Colletotrichum siamense]|uniref:WW domain-containing protein n=1 Tax=Colletotrichum siamense TaxID=690259 RepID=A0A9P5ELJ3_COLSI|nr:hypothetical protein CGCSCA4_v011218 [Colletotrichum siamense]KAF4853154.1 hypothetical protein CGCSCA2_v010005 [Colletotrichum siamense]
MQGTRCGIIKQQTSTMSQELDLGVIQRALESWVHQFFPRGIQSQSHEGLAMNDLAATISCGRAIEHYDLGRFSMLDAESALLQENKEPSPSKDSRSPIAPVLLAELNHLLPGAAIFATNEGHFGSGSGAARIGDEIFVVLGCDFPLVMRHVEDSKYSIVGPCYVPRLSHGEAVLGPLPNGWKMLFDGRGLETFTAPDGSHTLEDPRLEMDLPPGWEQKQKSNRSYLTWKRTEDNTWRIFDPRQTPEKLEARGIKLEMITVV